MNLNLTTKEKWLVWSVPIYLTVSGLFHIFLPVATNEVLAKPLVVHTISGAVTILAILQIRVKKDYICSIGITMLLHGLWRLLFSSFTTPELSYSNSLHGTLLLTGAAICLAIPYRIYRR